MTVPLSQAPEKLKLIYRIYVIFTYCVELP